MRNLFQTLAQNEFKYINGSYVKKQADGKFYSTEDLDYGTGPSGLKIVIGTL